VEGLSPAISIEQKSVGSNPRSTVGTVTEIYDYLRLLYARVGVQHCVSCHIPVQSQTQDQILDALMEMPHNTRIMVMSPLVKGRKGHYRELFETLLKQGYTRVRINGELKEIERGMMLSRFQKHDIELIVDRLSIHPDQEKRLSDSLTTALRMGENVVSILSETSPDVWNEKIYSTLNSCPSYILHLILALHAAHRMNHWRRIIFLLIHHTGHARSAKERELLLILMKILLFPTEHYP